VIPRRSAGSPVGGQFAPAGHTEPGVTLSPAVPSAPAGAGGSASRLPPGPGTRFTGATGSLTGFDPAARAVLMDETAPTVVDPEGRYPVVVGPRYDPARWRSSAEVARLVRADLRAAQTRGALPPSAVFSVRSDSFAGGQSVRVQIRNLPDREILDDHPDFPRRLSPAARELERVVRRVVNAYNRDRSGSQSDVFDVHYYGHVSIETETDRDTRQRLAAEEKTRAAARRTAAVASGRDSDTEDGTLPR